MASSYKLAKQIASVYADCVTLLQMVALQWDTYTTAHSANVFFDLPTVHPFKRQLWRADYFADEFVSLATDLLEIVINGRTVEDELRIIAPHIVQISIVPASSSGLTNLTSQQSNACEVGEKVVDVYNTAFNIWKLCDKAIQRREYLHYYDRNALRYLKLEPAINMKSEARKLFSEVRSLCRMVLPVEIGGATVRSEIMAAQTMHMLIHTAPNHKYKQVLDLRDL
jgi:hypothetical protein